MKKERLSQKQLDFLQAIADRTRYQGRLPCICISNMPERIWFTFNTEWQAYQWVRNLAERGFVEIQQDHFAHITEKGLSVTDQQKSPAQIAEQKEMDRQTGYKG